MASLEFLTTEGDLRMMQEFSEELVAASKEFADFIASSARQEEPASDATPPQSVEMTPSKTELSPEVHADQVNVADHPQEMEKIVFGPQPYRMLGE